MDTTLAQLRAAGFKIRCRLGRASGPLESDSLVAAAEAAVRLAKLRGWLS